MDDVILRKDAVNMLSVRGAQNRDSASRTWAKAASAIYDVPSLTQRILKKSPSAKTTEKDLADLGAFLNSLNAVAGMFMNEDSQSRATRNALLRAQAVIKTLTKNAWHDAAEDPPKTEGVMVLCWYEFFRYGDYNRFYQTYGTGYIMDGKWCGDATQGDYAKVTYWTEIPELPIKHFEKANESGADYADTPTLCEA